MKLYEALRKAALLYAEGMNDTHSAGMCYALNYYWDIKHSYDFMNDVVKPFIHQYSPEPIWPLRMCWWDTAGSKHFNPQIRIDCLNTLASYAEYLNI